MRKYLKMSDVFNLPVSDEQFRVDFAVISDASKNVIGGFGPEGMSPAAAHAINSHDEMAQLNQELLATLDGLLAECEQEVERCGHVCVDMASMRRVIAKARGQ